MTCHPRGPSCPLCQDVAVRYLLPLALVLVQLGVVMLCCIPSNGIGRDLPGRMVMVPRGLNLLPSLVKGILDSSWTASLYATKLATYHGLIPGDMHHNLPPQVSL